VAASVEFPITIQAIPLGHSESARKRGTSANDISTRWMFRIPLTIPPVCAFGTRGHVDPLFVPRLRCLHHVSVTQKWCAQHERHCMTGLLRYNSLALTARFQPPQNYGPWMILTRLTEDSLYVTATRTMIDAASRNIVDVQKGWQTSGGDSQLLTVDWPVTPQETLKHWH
jgi:hypothetical protein